MAYFNLYTPNFSFFYPRFNFEYRNYDCFFSPYFNFSPHHNSCFYGHRPYIHYGIFPAYNYTNRKYYQNTNINTGNYYPGLYYLNNCHDVTHNNNYYNNLSLNSLGSTSAKTQAIGYYTNTYKSNASIAKKSSTEKFGSITSATKTTESSSTINAFINKAKSYKGMTNQKEQCNKLFSPKNYRTAYNWYQNHGNKWAWCVDFVRWNAEQTFGDKLPAGMTSSVEGLKKWGDKYNCYTEFTKGSTESMKNFIINNIKPGNILLLGDYAHVAIVAEVNSETGEIKTIEGNYQNSVAERILGADKWNEIKGTVSLEQFA